MSSIRQDLVRTLMSEMDEQERVQVHDLLRRFGDERPLRAGEVGDGARWSEPPGEPPHVP